MGRGERGGGGSCLGRRGGVLLGWLRIPHDRMLDIGYSEWIYE